MADPQGIPFRNEPYPGNNKWDRISPRQEGERVTCSIGPLTYGDEEIALFKAYSEVIDLTGQMAKAAEAAATGTNAPEDIRARTFWSTQHAALLAKRDQAMKDGGEPIYL